MKILSQDLGYREMHTLAKFIEAIAWNGIPNDVAEVFYYDLDNDCAVCETESGNIITSDN